jgi:hypothetical protein
MFEADLGKKYPETIHKNIQSDGLIPVHLLISVKKRNLCRKVRIICCPPPGAYILVLFHVGVAFAFLLQAIGALEKAEIHWYSNSERPQHRCV